MVPEAAYAIAGQGFSQHAAINAVSIGKQAAKITSANHSHISFMAPHVPSAAAMTCKVAVNGVSSTVQLRYTSTAMPELAAVQLNNEAAGSYIHIAGLAEATPLVSAVQASELLLFGTGFSNSTADMKVCGILAAIKSPDSAAILIWAF